MATSTFFIISAALVVLILEAQSLYLPKRTPSYSTRERIREPRKRPFCNAFTVGYVSIRIMGALSEGVEDLNIPNEQKGCGRKRSNIPVVSREGEEIDESIGSLLDLSSEPAIEDLSRQIMSEAKLWEAIQEANYELNRRKQGMTDNSEDDAPVPPRSATASCALPPCYI